MSNRKSIFLKYFVIYSAVILISFICLGAVLLLVSSRYFLQEKKDLLDRNTQMIAEDITKMIEDSPTGWRKNAGQSMKDLASRNGTFLNGVRLNGKRQLSQNDVIKAGSLEIIIRW